MITTVIGEFKIELFNEAYNRYSADNTNKYDFFYPDEYDPHATQIGVKVFREDVVLRSALITAQGGGTRVHKTSFINEKDRFAICCSDTVFCLSIPDLKLYWKTKADFAACFQIFKLGTDYIIHGELEISRLSADGNIIWQQGGADIFTTAEGTNDDFLITDKYIFATDWEKRKYQFDFDGNLIE